MLLPGPEALQLAIFLGWKLHGVRGGLVAGLGFILPAILLLGVLSYVYAAHGTLPWVAGVLAGLQAAVIALVAQAMLRIGKRALRGPLQIALAVGSFLALEAGISFPWVLLAAASLGLWSARGKPVPATSARVLQSQRARGPYAANTRRGNRLVDCAPPGALGDAQASIRCGPRCISFSRKAALVTFGGAYAVLGYVTTHLVEVLGWVTAQQSIAGLALAETTPGPLVIVLQFLGFMTGWNQPGHLTSPGVRAARRSPRVMGHVPALVRFHFSRGPVPRAADERSAHPVRARCDHCGGGRSDRHIGRAARAGRVPARGLRRSRALGVAGHCRAAPGSLSNARAGRCPSCSPPRQRRAGC